MRTTFANDIKLALEILAFVVNSCDIQLQNNGLRPAGGGADVGTFGIDWHFTPAEKFLPLLFNDFFNGAHAMLALRFIGRQKYITGGKLAGGRQIDTQIFFRDLDAKIMWHAGENTRAVTGGRLTAAATTVLHTLQHDFSIDHDLMAGFAFDMRDKTHTTAVFFKRWVI